MNDSSWFWDIHIYKNTSKVVSKKISDLYLPQGCRIGAIYRNESIILAQGDIEICSEDRLIIFLLNRVSIWEFSLYKDFIYWFLTTGIVLFFRANNLNTIKDFIKIISTATSLTIILEFLIEFYNFSFVGEMILIPILTFISLLLFFAEMKSDDPNTKVVANILKSILTIIGFGILIYTIYQLITNYKDFFTLSNLKSFLLSPIFTLLFLPLLYFTVLYIKYEKVFLNLGRYKFLSEIKKKKIKISILRYCNINFNYIENANKIILFKKKELRDENDIDMYLRKNIKLKQHS